MFLSFIVINKRNNILYEKFLQKTLWRKKMKLYFKINEMKENDLSQNEDENVILFFIFN